MGVGGQCHGLAALPLVKKPGTHSIEGWVDPRASLGGCGKSHPHQDLIPGLCGLQQVATPTTLSQPTSLQAVNIFITILMLTKILTNENELPILSDHLVESTLLLCIMIMILLYFG